MKIPLLFISILSVNLTACATHPAAKMTVKVLDEETSAPISNCVVQTRFLVKSNWNDPDEYDEQKCISDADGTCVFSGIDDSFGYGGGVLASNYYRSSFKVPYTGVNHALNRWNPWNPTIEVKMRKIKNPVPMMTKQVRKKSIPVMGTPVGFDLEKADWVAPHGNGMISDFVFLAELVTQPKEGIRYRLTFSQELDGIQEYLPSSTCYSSYFFPYVAPTNGYIRSLDKYRLLKYPEIAGTPANNLKENKDMNYIFRVRTREDKDGNVISVNYGCILGEIRSSMQGDLYFEYWFNPIPNERSLEYNGENLLEK